MWVAASSCVRFREKFSRFQNYERRDPAKRDFVALSFLKKVPTFSLHLPRLIPEKYRTVFGEQHQVVGERADLQLGLLDQFGRPARQNAERAGAGMADLTISNELR